jgi:hypothetical protein
VADSGIDALKIAFYVILILALATSIYGHLLISALIIAIHMYYHSALINAIYRYYHSPPLPQPPLSLPQPVANQPASLAYNGPETTAIAGYYCIEGIDTSNGYSIQLNALLSNGLWIQDMYGPWLSNGQLTQPYYGSNVWMNKTLLHVKGTYYINATCAWLVMVIKNGYAYFGYSLDGEGITWYDS